ncbi:sensor histidine kinase [Paenibacillaceae bacterium]|nr:sensor histidine kinase [Paenibacillaceae bacterium]
MIAALLAMIALLLVLCILQYAAARRKNIQLAYMTRQLNNIINEQSAERLLIVTDDSYLQQLAAALNDLLDFNHRTMANYNHTEAAMKMMLTNISHDLKTPLTVVLGYLETISHKETMPPQERAQLLSKAHSKAVEMVALINRFFDLAKLESGDAHLPLNAAAVNEICKNSILFFYDILQSQHSEVSIEIPEEPVYALVNQDALERVLNNLLSNAISHGKDGKIVGIALRSNAQGVFIDVWDRGQGINERHKELVFERMYTLEDSRNPLFGGSGLGLTITQRLVRNMGGEITLKSKPYHKTVFTVRLKPAGFTH